MFSLLPGATGSEEHMRENAAASQAPNLTGDELRQVAEVREQL